ncbi:MULTISPECIES: DEAD/DEAH box helicase [Sphingobacterium]|jgi:ATP-dependent RNA helicase RhlE|uniref:DEAD-box ATP-dependent RNA helicase RhpA n=1 Tax=Sphingobacterium multivorum TaxID=28454 RepID=A0A2X2JQN0_SPHMU|nr:MULTISPECIES: DEAD/DEAH box helicase [Sphingobacterium]HAE66900.1 DEAD/DEAH box helicase [Sphingobacterium sp.]MDF2851292.1 box helicase [Sphingobacterium multivorum]OFV15598.1 DEAD/DEAH box helicase [Sphingobacterium sp. HMSC13C05]OJZ07168.1 MAG: DEAD/DEAH box helicase [Sphingobacterium sp. 40-24]QQT46335.1 DEAD/DEAH box helicase [Sphingobacterium multivorum]
MEFKQLSLIAPLLKAITETGYTHPTAIQQKAIPVVLQGNDLIGCAQTGTGKTAAFALPLLQRLEETKTSGKLVPIRALILTPTRELAIQIGDNINLYRKYLKLNYCTIFGGVSQEKQVKEIKKGVDILVATPGRLLDLMNQKIVSLDKIEILILDEADNMLDMGFIHDIKKILAKVPSKRQTLFFSATMPPNIRKFAHGILHKPIEVDVTPVSSTAEKVNQSVFFVEKKDKIKLLTSILKKLKHERTIVFSRTKHGADKIVKLLAKNGLRAAAIHGNKSQNARQKALGEFKDSHLKILIATDIAARGIDIEQLPLVINYDLPNVPETYVHRIGRTGRAGQEGKAVSFCDVEERPYLADIEKLIGLKIKIEKINK